jgi:hypothetical protein
VNRSAAVVAGIMVFHFGWSLVAAVQHLMCQRGTVLTNRRFRYQLVKACVAHGKPLGALLEPCSLMALSPRFAYVKDWI